MFTAYLVCAGYSGAWTYRLRNYFTVLLRDVQAIRSFKNDNEYRVKRPCKSAGAFFAGSGADTAALSYSTITVQSV